MMDKQTIDFYDSQVKAYIDLIEQQPQDPTLPDFIGRVPVGGLVLDLGCGPGHCAAVMRENGLQVDPVDASVEMVNLAIDTFGLPARQAVFSDIDAQETYDAVWANFSLLHAQASELPGIIAVLHKALKPAGIFHISMKLGQGSARDKLGRYYSYYSQPELKQLLTTAGFAVEDTQTGELSGLAGDLEPWIALLAKKI